VCDENLDDRDGGRRSVGSGCRPPAGAEDASPANPYSGDFFTRSSLTGDWGNARNDLAAKGITFDARVTQIGQGIVSGGKNGTWE